MFVKFYGCLGPIRKKFYFIFKQYQQSDWFLCFFLLIQLQIKWQRRLVLTFHRILDIVIE